MTRGDTILITLLTSIGMASAALAAPVGRMHQCPAIGRSHARFIHG
jgi:hypothetical protein